MLADVESVQGKRKAAGGEARPCRFPVRSSSSSFEEVRSLSDRLAVVYEGEFVDVVDPDAVTEEALGLLMAGERPDAAGEEPEAVPGGGSDG